MFCNVLYDNQDYTKVSQRLCFRQLLHRQHVADMDGVDPEFLLNRVTSLFCIQPSYFLFPLVCSHLSLSTLCDCRQHPQALALAIPGQQWSQLWGLCWVKRAVGGKLLPLHQHTSTAPLASMAHFSLRLFSKQRVGLKCCLALKTAGNSDS